MIKKKRNHSRIYSGRSRAWPLNIPFGPCALRSVLSAADLLADDLDDVLEDTLLLFHAEVALERPRLLDDDFALRLRPSKEEPFLCIGDEAVHYHWYTLIAVVVVFSFPFQLSSECLGNSQGLVSGAQSEKPSQLSNRFFTSTALCIWAMFCAAP